MLRLSVVLLFVAACASGTRTARACDPLPQNYQSYEGVYRECDVDQRVRYLDSPRPDLSRLEPLVTSSAGCYQAVYTMVVDEKGAPMVGSVKMVRTNSQSYALAVTDVVERIRFEPAKKNGIPVRQFHEYTSKMAYTVSTSRSGANRRPPPC